MPKVRESSVLAALAFLSVLLAAAPLAHAQIGRGGDQPAPNAAATAYRTEVRNRLNQLVIQLAGAWDASDPGDAAALYATGGVIVLGPDQTIQGRDAIRSAFASTLHRMRGVVLTIDGYDLSGELAFVRGTMAYELMHDNALGTQETATYAMVFRRQRNDDWLIQDHVLAGRPILPEPRKAGSISGATSKIKQ